MPRKIVKAWVYDATEYITFRLYYFTEHFTLWNVAKWVVSIHAASNLSSKRGAHGTQLEMAVMAIAVHHARLKLKWNAARIETTHSLTFCNNPEASQEPGMSETHLSFGALYLHGITHIYLEINIYNVFECVGLTWCVACAWNATGNGSYGRSMRTRHTKSSRRIRGRHIWIFHEIFKWFRGDKVHGSQEVFETYQDLGGILALRASLRPVVGWHAHNIIIDG